MIVVSRRPSEEAENAVGMASEWLELDSPDEWVRLDSELVPLFQAISRAKTLTEIEHDVGAPPRARVRVVPQPRGRHPTTTTKQRTRCRLRTRHQRLLLQYTSGRQFIPHIVHPNTVRPFPRRHRFKNGRFVERSGVFLEDSGS